MVLLHSSGCGGAALQQVWVSRIKGSRWRAGANSPSSATMAGCKGFDWTFVSLHMGPGRCCACVTR